MNTTPALANPGKLCLCLLLAITLSACAKKEEAPAESAPAAEASAPVEAQIPEVSRVPAQPMHMCKVSKSVACPTRDEKTCRCLDDNGNKLTGTVE